MNQIQSSSEASCTDFRKKRHKVSPRYRSIPLSGPYCASIADKCPLDHIESFYLSRFLPRPLACDSNSIFHASFPRFRKTRNPATTRNRSPQTTALWIDLDVSRSLGTPPPFSFPFHCEKSRWHHHDSQIHRDPTEHSSPLLLRFFPSPFARLCVFFESLFSPLQIARQWSGDYEEPARHHVISARSNDPRYASKEAWKQKGHKHRSTMNISADAVLRGAFVRSLDLFQRSAGIARFSGRIKRDWLDL